MKTEHPYAQVLRWIADGEMIVNRHGQEIDAREFFDSLGARAAFDAPATFRLKPRTISIGQFDVPEPMRVAPPDDTTVWFADSGRDELCFSFRWEGDPCEVRWLARGFCHTTREAAEAHTRALLSFTTTEAA